MRRPQSLKARAFVSKANPSTVPVPMDGYLAEAKAVVRVEDDLQEGMLGVSFSLSGKNYICVNGNDSPRTSAFHHLSRDRAHRARSHI